MHGFISIRLGWSQPNWNALNRMSIFFLSRALKSNMWILFVPAKLPWLSFDIPPPMLRVKGYQLRNGEWVQAISLHYFQFCIHVVRWHTCNCYWIKISYILKQMFKTLCILRKNLLWGFNGNNVSFITINS